MAAYGYEEFVSVAPIPLHFCVPLPHPDKQIRLLELDPIHSRDPNTAPPLHGRLRVVSLRHYRKYSALSYVWSQEDPGTSQRENRLVIHCDGHQHEARIGPNCWSALWHLSKTRGKLAIWVDSISINQSNNDEKVQQLPLMRAVYESAETTYFWLGEAEKGTDEAMCYLSTNVLSVSRGTPIDILGAACMLFLRRHTFQIHPHRSALHKIFTRPWIERLWTLQEAVLSHNNIVFCGERSIAWADLICALESIHFFRSQTLMLFFEDSYMPWLNLANLSRWFADGNARSPYMLGQGSDRFNGLVKKVEGQIRCLKWARWIYFGFCVTFVTVVTSQLGLVVPGSTAPLAIGFISVFAIYLYYWLLNTTGVRTARRLGLSPNFDAKSHSIVQELRTRKVTNPKDMYFGTLGILSDDSFATEGSLLDLYRRLSASLVCRTDSLDILLFANAGADNTSSSWAIDWGLETRHIWEKALEWIPTWEPNPASCGQLDSDLMHSESWMRLQRFYKNSALNKWFWVRWFQRLFWVVDLSTHSRLRRYRGATPGLRPFWDFRNQGQHLCVHGLVVNEIFCHFTPETTRSSTTEPRPALEVLTAAREPTNIDHIDLFDLSDTRGTSGAAARQSEVCMFTSLAHDALSDMTKAERMKAVDRLNKLIDVLTRSQDSARLLWVWWRKLLLSTINNQRPDWVEDLLARDSSLNARLDDFMESLAAEGLNVVRCRRTELCTGGIAFAGAAVHEGDSVALVSGVSYPLVLRPCGEQHFKLVGPIFLPEAMDGELVELLTPESVGEIILV